MDARFNLYFRKHMAPLQAQVDALLAEKKTDRDAEQTQMDLMLRMALNQSLSDGAIAVGSAGATIDTGATVNFLIGGIFFALTAITSEAIPAGTTLNAGNDTAERCKWLASVDNGGTVTFTQGAIVAAAVAAVLPAVPAGESPFGYFEIETDSSNDYIPGTTLNSAGGMTDTYVDLNWPNSGVDSLAALGAYVDSLSALGVLPRYKL